MKESEGILLIASCILISLLLELKPLFTLLIYILSTSLAVILSVATSKIVEEKSKPKIAYTTPTKQQEEHKDKDEEEEKNLKREAIKIKVMKEAVETERSYVGKLCLIKELFITPIREQQIISEEDIRVIFSDIEVICEYNKELLKKLEKWKQTGDGNSETLKQNSLTPGDVFSDFTSISGYLATYSVYCNNFETSAKKMQQLMETNSKFSRFLFETQKNPRCEGLNLESFLIMTVQRIPRYILLLKEIIKNTDKKDLIEIQKLEDSLKKITSLANKINESKGESQSKAMVFALQSQLTSLKTPLISQPSRKFIQEASVSFIADSSIPKSKWKSHRRHLILFNDLLIIGRASTDSQGKRNVIEEIDLQETKLSLIESFGEQVLIISIPSQHKVFAFTEEGDSTVITSLHKMIKSCISNLSEKRLSFIHH